MEEERIMTLHPQGKAGVNILKRRYDQMAEYILKTIAENQPVTFKDLMLMSMDDLTGVFDGKIKWYLTTVKLDLEARGMIRRIPNKSPQQLILCK